MGERRFSDKEMNAIIQRATELQMRGPADKEGATLAQIQQAASELGISADLVQRAASEIGPNTGRKRFSFLGGPITGDVSVVADGELRQEDWSVLLQELRKLTGRIGTATPVGNAFEWISRSPTGMHVVITPDRGRSQIDMHSDLSPNFGLCFALPGVLAMAAGASLLGLGTGGYGIAAWIAAQIITYCLGRTWFSRSSKKSIENLRVVAEAIANHIESERESAPIVAESEPLRLRTTSQ